VSEKQNEAQQIPDKIGRYEVRSRLGTGGMGHVYRVFDPVNQRELALKELKFSYPRALHYFKREFRAVASLSHPHLVSLYDLYHEDDRYFYTMELVDGRDIYHFVNQHGHVVRDPRELTQGARLERVFQSFTQLLQALDYLHSNGCIHRDIKPANILVDKRGKVRLVDFGVIKEEIPGGEGQSLSQVFGTSTYFSPEQSISSRVTSATDIYAAGVVLYELLVGVTPFEGSHDDVCEMHRSKPVTPVLDLVPHTHERLAQVCLDMLAKEPARRPSAREVLEQLSVPLLESGVKRLSEFIGRRAERAALHEALNDVRQGQGRLALFEGEEGVGKQACIEAFCQEARLFDASCFLGACVKRDHVSYRGVDTVVERLAEAYRSQVARTLRRLPARERAGLLEAFSFLKELLPAELHPEGDAHAGPGLGLFTLLRFLAEQRPLVLVVEHIHLADDEALDLLEALQAGGRFPPVLLILTYCPERVQPNSRVASFLEVVPTHPCSRHVQLHPLTPDELKEMAQQHLNTQDERLIQFIHEQTAGLPRFAQEMITALKQRQTIERFHDIIIRKIDTLSRPARRILAVVCLSVTPVPESVLEIACDLKSDEVYEGLMSLSAEELIKEETDAEGRVDVVGSHPKLMEVARTCITQSRVPMIHDRIARALAQTNGSAEQIERHYTRAGTPQVATRYAIQAAKEARLNDQHERAAELFQLALKGPFEPAVQAKIRVDMADSLARAGRYLEAAQTLESLADLSTSDAQRWRARRYQLYLMAGELSDVLQQPFSDKARVIIADLLLPLRPMNARSLIGDTDNVTARLVRVAFLAGTHNERALQEAGRLLETVAVDEGLDLQVVTVALARVTVLEALGDLLGARAQLGALAPVLSRLPPHELSRLRALEWEARLALRLGLIDEAKGAARALLVESRARGLRGLRANAAALAACAHLEAGEYAAADRLVAEAERCRQAQPKTLGHTQNALLRARQLVYHNDLIAALNHLRDLRRNPELQQLLVRREPAGDFALLHARACALLALREHFQLELPEEQLLGSLSAAPRALFYQARETLERALPYPEGWLTVMSVFEKILCSHYQAALDQARDATASADAARGELRSPQIQAILLFTYAMIKRLSGRPEDLDREKSTSQQGFMILRRAGAALPPEGHLLRAVAAQGGAASPSLSPGASSMTGEIRG